jgi:hypothetical protein
MLIDFEAFGTSSDAYKLCYAMAQYLEEYEECTGEELELDPIAIRCEYRAITLDEAREQYDIDEDVDTLEYLIDSTTVIETGIEDTYIIQEF